MPPIAATAPTTGIAKSAPVVAASVAVRPAATLAPGTPDWTRIPNCTAAAAAPPPGMMLPAALAESWEVATANQLRVRSATRCSAQSETKLAASNSTAGTIQYGLRLFSCVHDEKTWSRLGASR